MSESIQNLLDNLVVIARAEIGVHEVNGNNKGKRVREYQLSTWLEPAAWPWVPLFLPGCCYISG